MSRPVFNMDRDDSQEPPEAPPAVKLPGFLEEEVIDQVTKHSAAHEVRYCSCPCFEALLKFAEAVRDGRIVVLPIDINAIEREDAAT